MIIYKDLKYQAQTIDCVARTISVIKQIEINKPLDHNLAVELLIGFGDLQTALSDYFSLYEEVLNPVIKALNNAGKLAGRILLKSWIAQSEPIEKFVQEKLLFHLNSILSFEIPENLTIKVPEGYAYYGYYPETYLEAAEKCFLEVHPKNIVVLGIRSIGASFADVVAALFENKGCSVDLYTVRTKGNYDSRFLNLSRDLKQELLCKKNSHFLIVDEGPGLSGSSFGITAEVLSRLGIPDDRIVFLSSWNPDGIGLISQIGKERWGMHRKFCSSFEDTWIRSGRLAKNLPYGELLDISSGNWRSLFYKSAQEFPPTYPVEERKKYLCSKYPLQTGESFSNGNREKTTRRNQEIYLVKFAGLGSYGRGLLERANILSDSNFSPRVVGLENGFLIFEFIKGLPLKKENISYDMLHNTAEYLCYLSKRFPASPTWSFEDMLAMMTENISEYLGEDWMKLVEKGRGELVRQYSSSAVEIDGHMFPHEWIISHTNCTKTDGITHHADQFFPGCQSIAWDIAGFIVESGLDAQREHFFVNRFCDISGQKQIIDDLKFYKLAYLSFRMGYSAVASDVMTNTPEGNRAKKQTEWYASLLRRGISEQFS